jgi:predicted nucleotidyltransferase component of viral defense system
MEFPVILDMEAPKVNAYSLESSIAEKLEAIVKNGFLNSRYKDFYDIYVLSEKYPFNYEKLSNAVMEINLHRPYFCCYYPKESNTLPPFERLCK